jgi:hypothetical protein
LLDVVDFLCNVWPFVLFKILIQIFKMICYISNFFSNKINHNKIYDFSKNILNKTNGQTLRKKSIVSTREYFFKTLEWKLSVDKFN